LTSHSQPSEGGPSTQEVEGDEATKAKKKKKVEEPKSQLTSSKDQGGERRKKKKHEGKKAEIAVKVKSAIKKSKVHRVLKIHVSSESDGNPSPQNKASKKDVVKQDQTTKTAEEEVDGPQGNPAPHSETLVNDQPITDEGKQDNAQPSENAPNAEKNGNPTIDPEVEGKEVCSTLLSISNFHNTF
jgi:hypothetical protein